MKLENMTESESIKELPDILAPGSDAPAMSTDR